MIISWLLSLLYVCMCFANSEITFVIISHPTLYDEFKSNLLQTSIQLQLSSFNRPHASVVQLPRDVGSLYGYWTVWVSSKSILESYESDWYMFLEPDTAVNVEALYDFISDKNSNDGQYFGYPLVDKQPTIIHHFHGHDSYDEPVFEYPDFSAGLLMSSKLMKELVENIGESPSFSAFAIDAKHELARFVHERMGVRLSSMKDKFCLINVDLSTCITQYKAPTYDEQLCAPKLTTADLYVAVKTFSGYHKTRLAVLQNTWSSHLPHVEYFSDTADSQFSTITLGVENTIRGHCGKTFAILRHFLNVSLEKNVDWLLIADDDSLVSVPRLLKMLSCHRSQEKIIIGERYGYGFSSTGDSGYDYPTGGSTMLFSRSTVDLLTANCDCPADDSPDDMIIGMCARSLNISIIHNQAFHQARRMDYAEDYVRKLDAISFHKFEDIDPLADYKNYLEEPESALEMNYDRSEL